MFRQHPHHGQSALRTSCCDQTADLWVSRGDHSPWGMELIVTYFSTDAQKDLIKKSLYGHVCKLARHSVSADCPSSCSKERERE